MSTLGHFRSAATGRVATMTDQTPGSRNDKTPFPLSQETLAVLAVGATLLATMLVTTGRLEDRIDQYRVEAHEEREALRAEGRDDRKALRAEGRDDRKALVRQMEARRAEAHADREALVRQMEAQRAEAHAGRKALVRQMEAQRAEAHADREALRAEAREDRLTFARQIAIITREQAHLNGLVEGMRDEDDHPGSASGSSRDG